MKGRVRRRTRLAVLARGECAPWEQPTGEDPEGPGSFYEGAGGGFFNLCSYDTAPAAPESGFTPAHSAVSKGVSHHSGN